MRKRILAALAWALLAAAGAAAAADFLPFTVKDIRVEGVQRTDPGTVFSYLPVKVGETLTAEKAQQALRALFATGFFKDVRLETENGVLVVLVEERPAISQVDFSGVSEFPLDSLRRALRDLGLGEGQILDRAVLESAEQELKRQYLSRGKYAAEVQTTVTPLERNRVAINFAVTEGEVAKIRTIKIVGARAFAENDLLDLFVLRTPGWLTWYTKHDQYSRQRLSADLETLRSYYLDQGYLDFNVDSTQVSITPDRKDVYITVNITEGEKYTVSDVRIGGQKLVPEEELEKLLRIRPGDVFSRQRLIESQKAIADRLGNDGYAFANANAVPEVDREKRTVAFTILIDPGRRVYVRRINVVGNSKTRDEVVRREMRQLEGAYYDASKIQLSRRRIDRTRYFNEVTVDTAPVEGRPDQVDVTYTVEERSTGALAFGVGFSTLDKFILSASITQPNVFGTGKFLALELNSGTVNKIYSLSYVDPYYTVDGVSRGFDVYKRDVDASTLATGAYGTKTVGGGIKFSYPLSERVTVSFGALAESVDVITFENSSTIYKDFVAAFGNKYRYGAFTAAWARDTRDSLIVTTDGLLTRFSTELAGGDLQYYRLGINQQIYWPLSRSLTLLLNADLGYANGSGGKPLPFFKNYYAGGPGTVRGYQDFSLGPRDSLGNSLGGTRRVVGNLELLFPMPGAAQDKSLRVGVFVDAGQVYGAGEPVDLSEMRYSAGIALAWASPLGPLRLSYATPLNERAGFDRVQRLQLKFGTAF
ncbi:MAG: outer membrane protein assembly factor BamA [Betaproteobacteria bacterium]|nr:outer membrane protein assembly factor BamA [Betaproteobacteria bacterium]